MDGVTVKVDFSQKSFLLTGDSELVEKYYEKLVDLFRGSDSLSPFDSDVSVGDSIERESRKGSAAGNIASRYEQYGVFYYDGDTGLPVVQSQVPGANNRERMRNVALILLLANGNQPISGHYIKGQCERQSCLDPNNFSKAFGTDRKNFIKKGKAGSKEWTLELTIPALKLRRALPISCAKTTKPTAPDNVGRSIQSRPFDRLVNTVPHIVNGGIMDNHDSEKIVRLIGPKRISRYLENAPSERAHWTLTLGVWI